MRRLSPAVVLVVLACAQLGMPPGGPEVKVPPKLLGTRPESGAVNVRAKEVSFTFDAVLKEQTTGGGAASSLEQLVLISPRDGEPRVGWHRQTLSVRGRRDWKPNTAYTVTLLPGISDLRGNLRKEPVTVVFSTGPTIPREAITGIVFDWVAGKPIPNAMVEALAHPDTTTVYVAQSDSSGRFTIATIPAGTYTVRGYEDPNHNRRLDPREPWDSVHVALRDTAHVELLAFLRDTIGSRIDQVTVRDSVTLRVRFDKAVDTAQRVDTSLLTLKRADSTVVPIRLVESARSWDSTHVDTSHAADSARAHARADTLAREHARPAPGARAAADTTKRAPAPTPTRPSPIVEVVIVVSAPLTPGATYRLESRNLKNLLGYAATGSRTFQTPAAQQPPPKPAKSDTTRPPPPP